MAGVGAELLVATLAARGVRQLFTVSGNHVLSLYDATIERGVRLLHARHEASAVHMADAWGRLTGEPGVAVVTGGPGHLNALSALYGAHLAESPVVLLSGHAARAEIGLGAFQELDQVATAYPVAKAAWLAEDASGLARDVDRALALATTGRPGPVHVSLPTDVLEGATHDLEPGPRVPAGPPRAVPEALVAAVLDALGAAERPLVVAGPAMARGERWEGVARLGERLHVPVLAMESPRGVSDPGLREASPRLGEADLVVLIGKRLDYSLRFGRAPFFAEQCRFVRIDVDAAPEGRIALAIAADPATAVAQCLAAAAGQKNWPVRAWASAVQGAVAAEPGEWDVLRRSAAMPLHPLRVCDALRPLLDGGGVLVSDGGEFGQWAQAVLRPPLRLINGPSGSIGSAIPMALAAKLRHPERTVVVTLGDGTFGYAAAEFDTAVRYELPIVAVVGNDARWNAEYQLQIKRYGAARAVGCELLRTRYDRVVEALGGHGEWVEEAAALPEALARAVASHRPACVNVAIQSAPAPVFARRDPGAASPS
jgi:acetolactate synthase-1/2/3 large subunit